MRRTPRALLLLAVLLAGCAFGKDTDEDDDDDSSDGRAPEVSAGPRVQGPPLIGIKVPNQPGTQAISDPLVEYRWVPRISNPVISGTSVFLDARRNQIQPNGALVCVSFPWTPGEYSASQPHSSTTQTFPLLYDAGQDLFEAPNAAAAIPMGSCRSLVVINPNGNTSEPFVLCR